VNGLTWINCPDGSRIRAEDVRGIYVVASFTERPWHVRLAVTHLPPGKPEERGNYTYAQFEHEADAIMQAGMVMNSVFLGERPKRTSVEQWTENGGE